MEKKSLRKYGYEILVCETSTGRTYSGCHNFRVSDIYLLFDIPYAPYHVKIFNSEAAIYNTGEHTTTFGRDVHCFVPQNCKKFEVSKDVFYFICNNQEWIKQNHLIYREDIINRMFFGL